MGDYTPGSVIIYDVKPEHVAAVIGVLENHGMDPSWTYRTDQGGELQLCTVYGNPEVRGDESEDIASELIENAPSATFATWTDPKYEWLGSYVAHAPELGTFWSDCDSDGEPQFGPDQLEKLLGDMPADMTLGQFRSEELPRATGQLWRNLFVDLMSRNQEKVLRALPEDEEE